MIWPNLSAYDNNYYYENEIKESLDGSNCIFILITDTFEEFLSRPAYEGIRESREVSVAFLNDVHYYIPSLPKHSMDMRMFITGL